MNYDSASQIVRSILDRFPEKRTDRKAISNLQACLTELSFSPHIVQEAVSELIRDPKATFPTPQQIRSACESVARPKQMDEREREAEFIFAKHGRDMLSMRARKAESVCQWCVGPATAHGIAPTDPILLHEHFTHVELDASASLQLAIDVAQFGPWNLKRPRSQDPYNALTARYTREPSPDDAAAERIATRRRFELLMEACG